MMRGIWNRETVALVMLAAMLPVAVAWLWSEGLAGAGRLAFAVVIGGLWQALFTIIRAQPPTAAGAVSAVAMAMLAPDVGPLQLALGLSFGYVFGELVFGGWGRSVLNPAVVAITFLGFGFPAAHWPLVALPVGWAAIPAALIGLAFGILPWRVLAGALTVMILAGGFSLTLLTPAVAVVLVLLVCDPGISALTPVGRWLQGACFGALIALFAQLWDAAPAQMAVSAALLTALAAPLFDEIAIAAWRAARRSRHG